MYGIVWTVVGIVVILLILTDALWTTLSLSRAGWLSATVSAVVGRVSMQGPPRAAENASILALCATYLTWSLVLWCGWTLVFCGSADAVINSSLPAPATLLGRVYFSGFALTTLGVGDLTPGPGIWRISTVLAAASGFLLFTLFVTYAYSVITAVNHRRSLGAAVGHLGTSPEQIVLLLKGGGGSALSSRLLSLTSQLEVVAVQTDAFPVLEYSHVSHRRRSFARAVVTLGEVALLLEHAVSPADGLPAAVWKPLRNAVNLMISEKHRSTNPVEPDPPAMPDFDQLRKHGLQVTDNVAETYQDPSVQDMRGRWANWLHWHQRDWSDISEADSDE